MGGDGEAESSKRQKLERPQINDKETSDVVILLLEDGEELSLYAHKAVLTRHSDYFKSLFSERWDQGKGQSVATIDTSGKGGRVKYEKFLQFIYNEPIMVASLDIHGIVDMLEVALELLSDDIVNACERYLACVYWPEDKEIGARLMSLCDKFKCSQELAERLVEYGHLGHLGYLSALKQKAVDVWKGSSGFSEELANFAVTTLPIVPEEIMANWILPRMLTWTMSHREKIVLAILNRSLSENSDASNHLAIAQGLVRCIRECRRTTVTKSGEVEAKLNQLVSKLGEVEQWQVFVVWAEGSDLDWPSLRPSWSYFCKNFNHLPGVRDAAVKCWRESRGAYFVSLAKLLMEMMPRVLVSNFALFYENYREKGIEDSICSFCSDMLEQITAGKLLLDSRERYALAKHVLTFMSRLTYPDNHSTRTATSSLIKLIKTIPPEKRWDLLRGRDSYSRPSIAQAFEPWKSV